MKTSQRQSSHYDTVADDRGQPQLRARSMDGCTRSNKQHSLMTHQMEEFVHAFGKSVGCHPFLAGLRAVLQWNLESLTVVAWNGKHTIDHKELTHVNSLVLLILDCHSVGRGVCRERRPGIR